MVAAIGTVSGNATTPLNVRAVAAAGILSSATSEPPAQQSTQTSGIVSSDTAKTPLYYGIQVRYKFVYNQDYGRVVLLEERPATGQEISQVPSNYSLQQYAASIRAQRRTQLQKLQGEGEGQLAKTGAALQPSAAGGTTGAQAAVSQAAPAVAAAPTPVDIRV